MADRGWINTALILVGMGGSCAVGAWIGSIPERVYLVPASSMAAVKNGELVDIEAATVLRIMAWTNGKGSDIDFGTVTCLFGVHGDISNSLLSVGDVIHLRARMWDKKVSPRMSVECEVIGDKNQ